MPEPEHVVNAAMLSLPPWQRIAGIVDVLLAGDASKPSSRFDKVVPVARKTGILQGYSMPATVATVPVIVREGLIDVLPGATPTIMSQFWRAFSVVPPR